MLDDAGIRLAIVEAKRLYRLPGDGLQQAIDYARKLDVPLAYSTNGKGIVEHDFASGGERELQDFPSPADMRARWRVWRGFDDPGIEHALGLAFSRDLRASDGTVKTPRYYQRVAIDRSVQAILGGRRRVLLTLATGSGKTFVAMQIVWKLWKTRWKGDRNPRILYLADRNILIDQPITREFRPVFGDAVLRVHGTPETSREIYFALYQSLADSGDDLGLFRDYPRDFFDLVVVDECHRGSARDESTWRRVLEHFEPAAQLGMTATPLVGENADTYRYFGDPIYEYSLAQGIEDGFLAPYRVRRVVLSPDAEGWSPAPEQLDRFGREIPPGLYGTREFEKVVSLLCRTEAAAAYVTNYLRKTDRMSKTIVFCVDSEHALQMRDAIARANADVVRQFPDYVVRIVADEGDVGVEHLDDFADTERDSPVVATTSKLLSTGVDLPAVRNIVLFRPIGSIVEFKQIVGRGTRLCPEAGKLSFEIVDFVGATSHFADPEFDGPAESVVVEDMGVRGEVVTPSELASPGLESSSEDGSPRKLYVDGGAARVVVDTLSVLDPDTGELRTVTYEQHVADAVRRLYPHPRDLRSRWRTRASRDEVVAALEDRGISLAELGARTGRDEADPLDLLIHLAWNGPLRTRRERADRVRREGSALFAQHAFEARAILSDLLDKYAEHGIVELDDLRILEVAPLTRHGSPAEIAACFGGTERLREAVRQLADHIYAA
ncbi:MAG TPA: DEAD/DEAH box helicase family protein [Candidatus Polarisedimenticolaceae bacterium]|nr:DEAD/DEAH box helicase family protein [Candidatus Polarisedimenticolaceae bacterium]